jgi:5-carboxyvanillate decarboxylase
MRIIAIEEHFNTQGYVDFVFSRAEFPRREYVEVRGRKFARDWWTPSNFTLLDVDTVNKGLDLGRGRLDVMDKAGIDMQVLSLPGIQQFDAQESTRVARDINDELAGLVRRYPHRFAGLATIAPQNPESAAMELERSVNKLGLKGALICGQVKGEFLDNRKYWVIFETAEKLDVPVYIHPFMLSPDMIEPYLGYPGLSTAMFGFSAQTGLNALRLILSGIFDVYPRLKIILGHLGEALPFWLWRIDSRWEDEQKVPSASDFYKYLGKKPAQYFKDNFYVTTSGMFWDPVLKFTIEVLGADRVLFAADYPYEDSGSAVQFINSVSISDADREKICHANAEKLLRL